MITVGILTVSDRCAAGTARDTSGPRIRTLINEGAIKSAQVTVEDCIPDEKGEISSKLITWCDELGVNLIFTVGGTGFSPRDVTPEATRSILDKEAPGLTIAMIKGSLDVTPLGMLSRPVCGIRKTSLIVNLPGSCKAAEECFTILAPALKHAVDLIHGHKAAQETHAKMHSHHNHGHTCLHASHPNPDQIAFRPRHSAFPMISVEEAQKIVISSCQPIGTEKVHYLEAVNRILATDVYAHDPLPPFPASMKDGYAVIASDGSGIRQVVGASIAGSKPNETIVSSGFCARISTGAPLPPGADSVVMVEDTELIKASEDGKSELEIKINTRPRVGQDIRPIGSDIQRGEQVLVKGTRLTPSDIGILATVGAVEVDVYILPTVSVLSTGNELQESEHHLKHGYIRDSNRPTLISLIKQSGFKVIDSGLVSDDTGEMYESIKSALEQADVLVSTGGVSMGEKDLLRHVLTSKFDVKVHFGRVNMKPGKPTTFATCQYNGKPKLIFGLPGNPVSAVVTSYLYVIPACLALCGYPKPFFSVIKAHFHGPEEYRLDARPEYHRVSVRWESNQVIALSTGNQLSSRQLSLNNANGLAILPSKSDHVQVIKDGTVVPVIVIDKI